MTSLTADRRGEMYDRYFGHVSRAFVPPLIRMAALQPGQHVLDVATGTGLVAEAASAAVGPMGTIVAVDVASAMIERASERLRHLVNISFGVEDGQSLTFPAQSFDAVICGLGLMFFPDPEQGLREFNRLLRQHGRLALSVNTSAARSYNTRIILAISQYVPQLSEVANRVFAIGEVSILTSMLERAGFSDIQTFTETLRFTCPSFEAYFEEVEAGAGPHGRAYLTLSEDQRRTVRADVQRDLGYIGGPVEIDVEIRFAACTRPGR